MVSMFSEEQKLIAVKLSRGAKSADELAKELEMPYDKLVLELKKMIKLNLIESKDNPPKYFLSKEIQENLNKRKEISEDDSFKLKLKILIEAISMEEELLKKQLESIADSMKKEKDFTVYDSFIEEAVEDKELNRYSSFLEATLSVKDFKALVRLMYFYGPSSVEVIKPAKLEINLSDLQDGLVDMAQMIHAYNTQILDMMNRKELRDFHNKIYEK
ncbi:MAG: hypothetical protein JW703_02045 [Candidatus Diapherotrites archaeon]|nr:hypothetical protein [Candidatus Diapherotrites archaeon]